MVKDWDGFMGGSRFNPNLDNIWKTKNKTYQKKKKIQAKYVDLEGK